MRFLLLIFLATTAIAQSPKLLDPALKLEALATYPDIEAPATVVGAPDGSFYVGCDLRDGRLNTKEPDCFIVRYSSMSGDKKRTVFANKIFSPAGSAWHDGWLYVSHNPFLTRFRDTDADGIADVREDLITNLGKQPDTGLNDHLASGFTLGMDGFFYMSIGDRGTYQTRSVKDGSTISLQGGGIIRFRPDGTALEIFSSGTRNHLAVLLDAEDNAFTLDNTDDGNGWWTRLTHHIEGGYYGYPYDYQKAENFGVTQPSKETLEAAKRRNDQLPMTNDQAGKSEATSSDIGHWSLATGHFPFLPALTDFGGGSPTGGLCYLSDGLPEQYRGKLLFSEWGKGGLFVIEVARDGATFRFVKNTPLIQGGNGIDFRPLEISVAHDGSLLIADWQWGGWKGPKTVGTIWRLSWPDAKPAPRLKDERAASVNELVTALNHPDRGQRLRAQFVLSRQSDTAIGALDALLAKKDVPRSQYIHAMWALAAVPPDMAKDMLTDGPFPEKAVREVSESLLRIAQDRPEMRSQVVKILRRSGIDSLATFAEFKGEKSSLSPIASTIKAIKLGALSDADPEVRLQGVLSAKHTKETMTGLQQMWNDNDPTVRFIATAKYAKLLPNYIALFPAAKAEFEKMPFTTLQEAALTFFPFNPDAQASQLIVQWLARHARGVDSAKVNGVSVSADIKARAIAVLGRIAYRNKPWDGHWWGTQPVKNPPPLPSVAWEGTPAALQALTAALSDPDPAVRLAAAKAFTQFILAPPGATASVLHNVAAGLASATPESSKAAVSSVLHPIAAPQKAAATAQTAAASAQTDVAGGQKATAGPQTDATALQKATAASATAVATSATDAASKQTAAATKETAVAVADSGAASLPQVVGTALATLRTRLAAETDPAVRRALIEALGVQKDPGAMKAFTDIALDEKADAGFREAAINAVVNIGGDDARKTIARLASAKLSPAAARKIIQAAGELKVIEAAPALIGHLKDEDAANRESSAKSLARLAGAVGGATRAAGREGTRGADAPTASGLQTSIIDALIATLADKEAKVQTAAVEALGSFKDKRALPALLEFGKTKRARRETINAVAALMPDTAALPFLVDALREKGTGERRAALTALKKMRAEAWPMIEQNLASGRIPAEFAPEIRAAFDSGVIAKWKMIGPFENVWEAVHPPETDALAGVTVAGKTGTVPPGPHWTNSVEKLEATRYHNAEGREVTWTDVTSADANDGRMDLGKVFKTNAMVCAYAITEIESPEEADARLFCGSDDQIAVWLDGKKVHDSGSGSRGFTADQDEVPIHFQKGSNRLLVKAGNVGGGWEFSVRIPGVDGGKFAPAKEPAPDVKQRAFSLATNADGSWVNRGDAKRGEKLFHDPNAGLGGICASCHKVRGMGKEIGPDLSLVGSIYKRADLIVSLLEPSKTIALGFDQNMIETNGGETFIGALRQETGEAFTLVGVDGQPHVIKKTDVKTRKPMEQSLMPPGLTLALKPEEFADLLAYMETLK